MKNLIWLFLLLVLDKVIVAQDCVDESLINPDAICTMEYAPVCGCDGITYSNDCVAVNYGGVTSWTEGECSGGGNDCLDPSVINPDQICPLAYIPVCGCNGVTYWNSCEALYYNGILEWTDGVCVVDSSDCMILPEGYDFGMCEMVIGWARTDEGCELISGCGTINFTDNLDYSNYFFEFEYACGSQCDSLVTIGCVIPEQIDLNMGCITLWDPVCGCDGVTYGNECEAFYWGGVTTWVPGECKAGGGGCVDVAGVDFGDCDFNLGFAYLNGSCTELSGCGWLVDGIDYAPYFYTNQEACQAACSNYIEQCFNEAQVDSTYGCIEIFDPVCGCDSITYGNSCEAFYAGISSWVDGECNINSIGKLGELKYSLAPNPFMDYFQLSFGKPFTGEVTIMDAAGNRIESFELKQQTKFDMNFAGNPSGFYVLLLRADSGYYSFSKLVKE